MVILYRSIQIGVIMARSKEFDEERAVDAAVDCFWRHGYEATSVRDLAQTMGITGTSLYNAYGDKRALFVRSLERYANRSMRERISRLQAMHPPKQAIEAFLREIVDRSLSDRQRKGCMLVNSALDVAPHDARIAGVVGGYLEEIRRFFERNIEAARETGQLNRQIDARQISTHFLGVVIAVRVLARTGARRQALQAVVAPALGLLKAH
jgi:TetR/AcrR family transcriptional repressor of nem operon